MRKILILLLTVFSLFSSVNRLAAENKVVVIKPGSLTETTTRNRAPVFVPIQAYYDSFTSSVYVVFNAAIGYVNISITNQDTGEYIEDIIDAYGTVAVFPISGDPGLYYLSFTLQMGLEYYGEFEIVV